MSWLKCANGTLLNTDNIIILKVHRGTCMVQAECVGSRTVDVQGCDTREEAQKVCCELAGLKPPAKAKAATPPKAPAKK